MAPVPGCVRTLAIRSSSVVTLLAQEHPKHTPVTTFYFMVILLWKMDCHSWRLQNEGIFLLMKPTEEKSREMKKRTQDHSM